MKIPQTPAGRLAIVQELMRPPIVDECGCVIGYGEPLVTLAEAIALLEEVSPDLTEVTRPIGDN